jgi:hypothetical protein
MGIPVEGSGRAQLLAVDWTIPKVDRKGPRNVDLNRQVTQRTSFPYPAIRGFVGPKRFPPFLKARLPGGLLNPGDILRVYCYTKPVAIGPVSSEEF